MKFLNLAKNLLEADNYVSLYNEEGEMINESLGNLADLPKVWVERLTKSYSLTVGQDSGIKIADINVTSYSNFKKAFSEAFKIGSAEAWFVKIDGSYQILLYQTNGDWGRPMYGLIYATGEQHSNQETRWTKAVNRRKYVSPPSSYQVTNKEYGKNDILNILERKFKEIAFGAETKLYVNKAANEPDPLTNHKYAKMDYDSDTSRTYDLNWSAFFKDHSVEFGAITIDQVRKNLKKDRANNKPQKDDLEDIRRATLQKINGDNHHNTQEALDALKQYVNAINVDNLNTREIVNKFSQMLDAVVKAKYDSPVGEYEINNPPEFITKRWNDDQKPTMDYRMKSIFDKIKNR